MNLPSGRRWRRAGKEGSPRRTVREPDMFSSVSPSSLEMMPDLHEASPSLIPGLSLCRFRSLRGSCRHTSPQIPGAQALDPAELHPQPAEGHLCRTGVFWLVLMFMWMFVFFSICILSSFRPKQHKDQILRKRAQA